MTSVLALTVMYAAQVLRPDWSVPVNTALNSLGLVLIAYIGYKTAQMNSRQKRSAKKLDELDDRVREGDDD